MSKIHLLPAALRAVFTLVLLALAGVASAQSNFPPDRLTYQGFLVDGLGNALATNSPKNYDVIFRIYATQTGTNSPLWGEQQTVTVDKGYFSVLLGEGTVVGTRPSFASLLGGSTNSSDRYVGLTVKGIGAGNADVDILPRLRLLPAPYAFLARGANALVSNGGSNVVTVSGNAVSVSGPLAATSFSGTFTGSAAGLSGLTSAQIPNLDAGKITTGNLADARLSANVALRAGGNTFSANQVFNNNVGIGTNSPQGVLHIVHGDARTNANPWPVRIQNSLAQSPYITGMRVANDGWFEVCTTASNSGNSGSFARLNSVGTWTVVSDRRMKEAIRPLHDMLTKAMALEPVSFRYKNQTPKAGEPDPIGFIAQNVEEYFPSLVVGGPNAEVKTLDYSGLSVVAIGAVQELNQQVKAENKSLRDSLNAKDVELAGVKERLAALEELVKQSLGGAKAAK